MSRALVADPLGERAGEDLVAAPAALVGRQLLEADDLGQQRPDQRAGRVAQASMVAPRQLMRFMILTSGSPTISSA